MRVYSTRRHHAPLYVRAHDVAQAVEDLAQGMLAPRGRFSCKDQGEGHEGSFVPTDGSDRFDMSTIGLTSQCRQGRLSSCERGNFRMADNGVRTGHRERLRQRFLVDPISLTDAELLELLLTCAIPRQDVAPQAQALLQRFRGLRDVFAASPAELRSVPGIGEQSALLLGIIARLMEAAVC